MCVLSSTAGIYQPSIRCADSRRGMPFTCRMLTVRKPVQTGEQRAIVSPVSGTTRDAVDTELTAPDGSRFTLVDTAGIRRRTSVASSPDGAEPLSVGRAIRAIRRCDVRSRGICNVNCCLQSDAP